MFFNISVWEYFINFMEILLFYLFINQKLHPRNTLPYLYPLQFIFLFARFFTQSVMNACNLSAFVTLVVSCFFEIIFALLFYKDSVIVKIFWGFMYSVICMVAEYVSLFIPQTISGISAPEVLLGGSLRVPFSMLYIMLIAVFIFLLHNFNNKNIILSPLQKMIYLGITIGGISIGYYIMILTMEAEKAHYDSSFVSGMILVNLCFIVLFLFLLLYIYQLGGSKERIITLLEEQKLHKLEELEYQNLIQTTESLRTMKHDMNIHLDVIQSLANAGNTAELLTYIKDYQQSLEESHHLLSTGNNAIDCILSSKIQEAKKQGIDVDFSILVPENFPFNALSLSSLLGNLWNNALEACQRLKKSRPDSYFYIRFYIKPFQQMVLIHIENPFDGILITDSEQNYLSIKDKHDHGIGLKRIHKIVEAAEGNMQIDTTNNIFTVHIMIPMEEILNENKHSNS